MYSFVLVAYAHLAASRNLLQQLLACLNFNLHSQDLFYWYKQKKVIFYSYGSSTSSWKSWRLVRFDLILTMRDILEAQGSSRLQSWSYTFPTVINDLPDVICNTAIYADDTTLYSKCDQAYDLPQLELASELESDL